MCLDVLYHVYNLNIHFSPTLTQYKVPPPSTAEYEPCKEIFRVHFHAFKEKEVSFKGLTIVHSPSLTTSVDKKDKRCHHIPSLM